MFNVGQAVLRMVAWYMVPSLECTYAGATTIGGTCAAALVFAGGSLSFVHKIGQDFGFRLI